jgi:hypothetical protein
MNTNSILTKLPSDFYAAMRNQIGNAAGLLPQEWANEVVPHKLVGRVYDFDGNSAQAVRAVLTEAFGHNGMPAPLPDLDETVADYVVKTALWLFRQNIGAHEATETLRTLLNRS